MRNDRASTHFSTSVDPVSPLSHLLALVGRTLLAQGRRSSSHPAAPTARPRAAIEPPTMSGPTHVSASEPIASATPAATMRMPSAKATIPAARLIQSGCHASGLDEQVEALRNRPLEGRYPYLWLDAKVEKVRDGGRVVRKALVLAYGVHESGYREVIALDVGEAETEAFWRSFMRSLVKRGLTGVQLVTSDAHAGLKKAIGQVLGCPWQRCSVRRTAAAALQRRDRRACTPARRRRARAAREAAAEGRGGCSKKPRTTCSPSMPSGRPLGEAALNQPARACQPRDRTAHRRRRHLPQQPRAAQARHQRRHRAERRMARR